MNQSDNDTIRYRVEWIDRKPLVARALVMDRASERYPRPVSTIRIEENIEVMIQFRQRWAIVTSDPAGAPWIFVSPLFRQLPKPAQLASIWHELGHIHHKHFVDSEHVGRGEITNTRYAAVTSGGVQREEVEADSFAIANGHGEGMLQLLRIMHMNPINGEIPEYRDLRLAETARRIVLIESAQANEKNKVK